MRLLSLGGFPGLGTPWTWKAIFWLAIANSGERDGGKRQMCECGNE